MCTILTITVKVSSKPIESDEIVENLISNLKVEAISQKYCDKCATYKFHSKNISLTTSYNSNRYYTKEDATPVYKKW